MTGAASGLGRAFALAIADAGGVVACLDTDLRGAQETAADAAVHTLGAVARRCDVTNGEQVREVIYEVDTLLGGLDVLVNNAGVSDRHKTLLHESDPAEWSHVIDVDLLGVYHCSRSALALMMTRGHGKIVNIASVWGLVGAAGVTNLSAYSAAKGAVVNLSRELALQYAPHGIQVNALCPGFVRTGLGDGAYENPEFVARLAQLIPVGRVADPEDLCGPLLFLVSSDADYVTGHILVADGGFTAG